METKSWREEREGEKTVRGKRSFSLACSLFVPFHISVLLAVPGWNESTKRSSAVGCLPCLRVMTATKVCQAGNMRQTKVVLAAMTLSLRLLAAASLDTRTWHTPSIKQVLPPMSVPCHISADGVPLALSVSASIFWAQYSKDNDELVSLFRLSMEDRASQ